MRRLAVWEKRPWAARCLSWWHRNWIALLLACSSVVTLFLSRWLLRHGDEPPVGVYIAIMGLLAALLALRKEPSAWEKAAWVVLITAFMVAEVQNLYRADREQTQKFSSIIGGLDTSRQKLEATKLGLDTAANRVQDAISDIRTVYAETTGGDSYVYFEIVEPDIGGPIEMDADGLKKGMMVANTFVKFVGTFPLHHVFVNEIGPQSQNYIDYGDLFPIEMGRPRVAPYISFYPDKPTQFFQFIISTSNGNYSQTVLVKKFGNKWLWASRFSKYGRKKPIRVWAAPGFPKDVVNADWDKLR